MSSSPSVVKVSTFGWVVILVILTASLLGLPLILPPLPPPPLILLFFPVGIMVALMCLAFSPSSAAASHNVAFYSSSV
ncbi:hypothetical protein BVRB_2g047280 [Beta vulgaris subsp. vulgaris]|uniref:Transmembrane protein n=1 Tax=Beta vulgaris subsp. vulgaris TaxID=3555 RepID=A0A0J8BCV0_BETVV|nr:hypothetical protein BVRB_2g047280 [Beta vulgaris subsp. vulgaris]